MLEIIRDDYGNILAAAEWRKVNEHGQNDKNGKYIWIHEVEISKPYRDRGMLKELIRSISNKFPEFEAAYFRRDKYNGRVRIYPKRLWLSLIKEGVPC